MAALHAVAISHSALGALACKFIKCCTALDVHCVLPCEGLPTRIATSTKRGSISMAVAAPTDALTARMVVPEPQKVSSTMSSRRLHVLDCVRDQGDRFDRRMRVEIIHPPRPERVDSRITPNIRTRPTVTTELDVVECGPLPTRKTPMSSCRHPVKRALSGIRLHPDDQVQRLPVHCRPGLKQFADVSPVHA